MKHLKYFLVVFILLLCPNVFAYDINLNSSTSATRGGTKNRYSCFESYQYGSLNTCSFGTTYNGRMGQFEGFLYYPFEGQVNYTLTLNMASDDFRNNFKSAWYWDCEHNTSWSNSNTTVIMPTYVSYRKIRLNITPSQNMTCVGVIIRSKNYPSDAFTGVNNWTLSNIILSDPTISSGGGGSSPSPTPSTGNQDIINNQTQNTQDIINNQSQNTQDIIDNNNSNTQDIINNQNSIYKTCNQDDTIKVNSFVKYNNSINLTIADEHGVNWTGQGATGLLFYQVIPVAPYTRYNLNYTRTNVMSDFRVYIYKGQAEFTGSNIIAYDTTGSLSFDTGLTNYITVGFYTPTALSSVTYRLRDITLIPAEPICDNKLDALNEAINDTNAYLKDDSNPNIQDNEFMNMFNGVGVSDPLNYLLTLPTQLINKIVSLSGSCSPIELGSLYGTMLTLPCINIENIVGSSVWGIIDVIFSVSLLVVIFKNLYDTFSNLLTMGAEKEAKEKFSMPTPMDFLSMILGGDR